MNEEAPMSSTEPAAEQPRRRLPAWLIPALIAGVLVLALGIGLSGLWLTHRGDGVSGYGQNASKVLSRLHACADTPQRVDDTSASCTTPSGDTLTASTFRDETAQSYFVPLLEDNGTSACLVSVKGVIIAAHDESALIGAIGTPEQFATDHHGYYKCLS